MESELKAFLDSALDRLVRANADRKSPFRLPVLATVGADGLPDARTVVLRRFERLTSEIIVFSDSRAKKISDLAEQPIASLTWWDKAASLQVRARAHFRVETSGPDWQRDLERVRASGAADYISTVAPGQRRGSAAGVEGQRSGSAGAGPEGSGTPPVHFARLIGMLTELDVLFLGREVHRRAKFRLQIEGGWSGSWVQA